MVNLRGALAGAVSDEICTQLGTAAAFATIATPITALAAPGVGLSLGAAALGLSAGYGLFCNAPAPPLSNPPGFLGGQCTGIRYRVEIDWTYYDTVTNAPTTINYVAQALWGPIGQVQQSNDGTQEGLSFTSAQSASNPSRIVNGVGSVGFNASNPIQINDIRVTTTDGGPDNCGNAPDTPVAPAPGPIGGTRNITYVNNEGNDVTIPVGIVLGYAQFNANLDVEIPFTANVELNPDFDISGTVNLKTGDVNFNIGGDKGGGSPCSVLPDRTAPDTGTPEPPDTVPDPPSEDPPTQDKPKRERRILGAIVTVTAVDGVETVIFQEENPDIYVPALGYIQFQIKVGGKGGWTSDIPVKSLRAFIPCPWPDGAVRVVGTPRPGNEFVVSPVYVTSTILETYPPNS